MIREKRRRRRNIKRILKGILVFLLFAAAAVFIVLNVFTVKHVKVQGNQLYDADVIKKAVLNDEHSWNSLYVFLKYKFVDTQEIPFVDTMEVSLKDPQTLTIQVYEKGTMGYLYIPSIDENAYFDKDGIVVETSSRIIGDTPQIVGIDCDRVVLYEKLPIKEGRLREILMLTQVLKRNSLVADAVVYGGEHEPELLYGKIRVELGSMEFLTQKVERLAKIKPELSGMEGTLHLENWTEETTNIVFDIEGEKTGGKKKDKKKS